MLGQELALTKTLIDVFAMGDAYDEANFMRPLVEIMTGLDAAEADLFARSYSSALRTLSIDGPRWRQATDLAVRLDLYEVVDSLLEQLPSTPDPHQLANLIVLSRNPAVSNTNIERVHALAERSRVSRPLRRYNDIRQSPETPPATDLEAALAVQMWPAAYPAEALSRVSPLVYLAEMDAPRSELLAVAAQIASVGARVRRVPASWNHASPDEWITSAYPMVTWSGLAAVQLRAKLKQFRPNTVPAPSDWASQLAIPRMLNSLQGSMPHGVQLRIAPIWDASELPAFSVETLDMGAFDTSEMSYLGAASRATLSRIAKEGLSPLDADVHRWAFDQLITLRIFQAFKARSGKPFRGQASTILNSLAEMARAGETQKVGLDANGQIVRERNGEFFELHSNQRVFDQVLLMDDAFKPFTLGGGNVPDLLRPERTVTVHPSTLAGTPAVAGRRISARAIAQMASTAPQLVVPSAYPELSQAEIADALRVGRRINMLSQS